MGVMRLEPGKSPLDAIANALQVVNTVYGIKANSAALERARADAERQKVSDERATEAYSDQRAGVLSKADWIKNADNFTAAKQGDKGSILLQVRAGDKLEDIYVKPKEKTADPFSLLWKQTQGERYATSQASELRKEYLALPTTKQTQDVASAMERIRGAADDPSPAGDISLIFNFMKMNDPGSTVREGEYATARNAAGVPDQVRNAWNRAIDGQSLNPRQRQDFINNAGRLYNAQLQSQKNIEDRYVALSKKRGIDPTDVILPFKPYEAKKQGSGFPGVSNANADSGGPSQSADVFPGVSHDAIAQEKARRAAAKGIK